MAYNYEHPGFCESKGAIFLCNRETLKECLNRELAGLPSSRAQIVKSIKPGIKLFLFECDKRQLHGVFEATSEGDKNIVPDAYLSSGMEFPWQVRFRTLWSCYPLRENDFSHIMHYIKGNRFELCLSRNQVNKLINLFSAKKRKIQGYSDLRMLLKSNNAGSRSLSRNNFVNTSEKPIDFDTLLESPADSLLGVGNYLESQELNITPTPYQSQQTVLDEGSVSDGEYHPSMPHHQVIHPCPSEAAQFGSYNDFLHIGATFLQPATPGPLRHNMDPSAFIQQLHPSMHSNMPNSFSRLDEYNPYPVISSDDCLPVCSSQAFATKRLDDPYFIPLSQAEDLDTSEGMRLQCVPSGCIDSMCLSKYEPEGFNGVLEDAFNQEQDICYPFSIKPSICIPNQVGQVPGYNLQAEEYYPAPVRYSTLVADQMKKRASVFSRLGARSKPADVDLPSDISTTKLYGLSQPRKRRHMDNGKLYVGLGNSNDLVQQSDPDRGKVLDTPIDELDLYSIQENVNEDHKRLIPSFGRRSQTHKEHKKETNTGLPVNQSPTPIQVSKRRKLIRPSFDDLELSSASKRRAESLPQCQTADVIQAAGYGDVQETHEDSDKDKGNMDKKKNNLPNRLTAAISGQENQSMEVDVPAKVCTINKDTAEVNHQSCNPIDLLDCEGEFSGQENQSIEGDVPAKVCTINKDTVKINHQSSNSTSLLDCDGEFSGTQSQSVGVEVPPKVCAINKDAVEVNHQSLNAPFLLDCEDVLSGQQNQSIEVNAPAKVCSIDKDIVEEDHQSSDPPYLLDCKSEFTCGTKSRDQSMEVHTPAKVCSINKDAVEEHQSSNPTYFFDCKSESTCGTKLRNQSIEVHAPAKVYLINTGTVEEDHQSSNPPYLLDGNSESTCGNKSRNQCIEVHAPAKVYSINKDAVEEDHHSSDPPCLLDGNSESTCGNKSGNQNLTDQKEVGAAADAHALTNLQDDQMVVADPSQDGTLSESKQICFMKKGVVNRKEILPHESVVELDLNLPVSPNVNDNESAVRAGCKAHEKDSPGIQETQMKLQPREVASEMLPLEIVVKLEPDRGIADENKLGRPSYPDDKTLLINTKNLNMDEDSLGFEVKLAKSSDQEGTADVNNGRPKKGIASEEWLKLRPECGDGSRCSSHVTGKSSPDSCAIVIETNYADKCESPVTRIEYEPLEPLSSKVDDKCVGPMHQDCGSNLNIDFMESECTEKPLDRDVDRQVQFELKNSFTEVVEAATELKLGL